LIDDDNTMRISVVHTLAKPASSLARRGVLFGRIQTKTAAGIEQSRAAVSLRFRKHFVFWCFLDCSTAMLREKSRVDNPKA